MKFHCSDLRRSCWQPVHPARHLSIVALAIVLLLISSTAFAIPADELLNSLRPTADVNDYAKVLTPSEKTDLENQCRQLREKNGAELSVVIIKSLEGGQIDDTAVKLFERWKIGKRGKDNGVLVLVAIEDRRARIEVGYGLEPVLPDILAGQILREDLFPAFRQQQYAAGLKSTISRIVSIIERNEPAQVQPQGKQAPPEGNLVLLLFLLVLALPPAYAAGQLLKFGDANRALAQLPMPGISVLLTFLFGLPLLATLIVAGGSLISGFFGLVSGSTTGESGGRRSRQTDGPWAGSPWIGPSTGWGGGGFSGGGGGSWGGFGGGSSGGGGASGGW